MKKSIVAILGLLMLGIAVFKSETLKAQTSASFQSFYDGLSPYGEWIDDAQYGHVWVPAAEDGFTPYYTNGYWVMTEFGNTWVSHYPWGWAPFHYGRWTYDVFYGWIWIPGYEWGPAWVYWRHGGGYYGWAPLGPGFSVAVTLGHYHCPDDWWIFVPHQHMYRRQLQFYAPRTPRNSVFINNTTIINNTYRDSRNNTTYIYGPRSEEYRAATGKTPRIHRVEEVTRPADVSANNDRVRIYRPDVMRDDAATRPSRVAPAPRTIGAPQPVRSNEGRTPEYRINTERTRTVPAPAPRTQPEIRRTEPQRTQPAPQRAQPERTPQAQPQRAQPGRVQPQAQPRPAQQPTEKPAARPPRSR